MAYRATRIARSEQKDRPRMSPPEEDPPPAPSPAKINGGCLLIAFLGVPIIIVTLFGYRMFIATETSAEVLGHRWERRLDVEVLKSSSETAPCNRIPLGALDIVEIESGPEAAKGIPTCSFRIDRWELASSEITSGEGLVPGPVWASPEVDGCSEAGCTRLGRRGERLFVDIVDSDGDHHECNLSEQDWKSLSPGMKRSGKKSFFLGAVACRSFLRPQTD